MVSDARGNASSSPDGEWNAKTKFPGKCPPHGLKILPRFVTTRHIQPSTPVLMTSHVVVHLVGRTWGPTAKALRLGRGRAGRSEAGETRVATPSRREARCSPRAGFAVSAPPLMRAGPRPHARPVPRLGPRGLPAGPLGAGSRRPPPPPAPRPPRCSGWNVFFFSFCSVLKDRL